MSLGADWGSGLRPCSEGTDGRDHGQGGCSLPPRVQRPLLSVQSACCWKDGFGKNDRSQCALHRAQTLYPGLLLRKTSRQCPRGVFWPACSLCVGQCVSSACGEAMSVCCYLSFTAVPHSQYCAPGLGRGPEGREEPRGPVLTVGPGPSRDSRVSQRVAWPLLGPPSVLSQNLGQAQECAFWQQVCARAGCRQDCGGGPARWKELLKAGRVPRSPSQSVPRAGQEGGSGQGLAPPVGPVMPPLAVGWGGADR